MQLPPACCRVNTVSPTVMRPVRALGVLLTAAVQATVPLPVPVDPEDMVSHVESLTAVRLHEETLAVTEKVPVLDEALMDWELGLRVRLQAAACVMLNDAVPIWMVAVRLAGVVLAS